MATRETFSESMTCPFCEMKHEINFLKILPNEINLVPDGAEYQGQCMFTGGILYIKYPEEVQNGDRREEI